MHSNPAKHDHISAKKNRCKLIKLCCDDCLLDFYEPIVDRKQKIDQFWLHSKQSKRFGTVLPSFMLRRMTLLHFFRHSRSFCLIICKFSICIVRYCMFPRILCQCFIDHGYFWNKLPAYSAYFQYDRACFLHIMSKSIDFIFKCMEYNVQWEMQG